MDLHLKMLKEKELTGMNIINKIIKNRKTKIFFILIIFLILVNIHFIFAAGSFTGGYNPSFAGATYAVYGSSTNPQFNNPSFFSVSGFTSPEVYWPKFNKEDCFARQDMILQIAPGGCSPSVVTSDLLEEQNVPVFCKIMAIQVNPLIDVSKIRSIRFAGTNLPKGVSSISYYPARAAVRSEISLTSSPVKDNLGYLVIVLSRIQAEKDMPEFVQGNVTATIDYDVQGAFGIGKTNFYVSELTDDEWNQNYERYGFWNGKGYVRAELIEPDRATIAVYKDINSKQAGVSLKKGEISKDIYLSGFYCAAGMNIKLESIDAPVDAALIQIDNQMVWVSKGDTILDGKCRVLDLQTYSGGGKASISCNVRNGKFDLIITPGKASFNVDGAEKQYYIGQKVRAKDNLFLGYVGKDFNGLDFAVLIKDNSSSAESEFADKGVYGAVDKIVKGTNKAITEKSFQESINKSIIENYKIKLRTSDVHKILDKDFIKIVLIGENSNGVMLKESFIAKDKEWDNEKDNAKLLSKQYYDEAIKNYEDLADLYANEKDEKGEVYASNGLLELARLSKKFGMNKKSEETYDRLINDYPDSSNAKQAKIERDLLTRFDSYNARALININGERYFFNLINFKKPEVQDLNAILLINGKEVLLGIDEFYDVKKDNKNGTIQLKEIKDDYVSVRYFKERTDLLGTGSEDARLTLYTQTSQQTFFDNFINVKLINITFKKEAKLTLDSKTFGPRTSANFSFKIGIEKRAIKLSPDKTKELINSLDETMKKWGDANNKLGQVVKVLKGVCLATAATLTVKNLVSGFNGASMARNALMTKQGGWNDFCRKKVEDKAAGKSGQTYSSVQSCLLDYNPEIEKDIQLYTNAIDKTNNDLKKIQEGLKPVGTDPLDMEKQVETEKVRQAYYEQHFKSFYEQNQNMEIALSNGQKAKLSDVAGGHPEKMTLEDMRNLVTFNQVKSSGESMLNPVFNNQLGKDLLYTYQLNEQTRQNDALVNQFKNKYGGEYPVFSAEKGARLQTMYAIQDSDSKLKNDLGFSERMFIHSVPLGYNDSAIRGQQVSVGLTNEGGIYKIKKVINSSGDDVTQPVSSYFANYYNLDSFKLANIKAYQNKMANVENLRVKFFEQSPYKGMPAEIPFDVENGWYVEMSYVLTGFGKPYDESGRVMNFYICNVGQNGRIEFKQSADDICRYYNGDINSIEFPGMGAGESKSLISRAQQAIAEASRQYSSANKGVQIGNRVFKTAASLSGNEGRCSDFMSPQDCNIMFNVCDPVICPSSRCNLGGAFQVDNVIQTGILGSLVLCAPNAREGILAPVCLSGVHAGVEGLLNVFNETKKCLNESLATGKNVGICDAIKSVYLCKLFWEEATPFMKVLIPRLIQSFYSQGVRGGGEYLTVQSAWDNTQSAIEYFKNDYAVNSMQAFTSRSTAETGSEVCKSFTSVAYPNSKDFFDKLLEPDSPVQFTGWFSEDILTTATVPSTSHYKVYYHIYSGKDQPAYYVIYLKDLPQTSLGTVPLSQQYMVDSGYIQKGNSVDNSRDFTAVSGYRQLCINVNGQDKCGFKSISSSYSLTEASSQYAAEQIKTDIKTEKECVAGTPSALSLIGLSLQQGAEEIINPELYKRGIIRVCATENPGKRVDSFGQYDNTNSILDRWKQVGYCDDPTIRCWLDTVSVKNVIKDLGLLNETLGKVDMSIFSQGLLTNEQGKTIASEAKSQIDKLKIERSDNNVIVQNKISDIVKKLQNLTSIGLNNGHRARGFFLLSGLYKKVSESLYGDNQITTTSSAILPPDDSLRDNVIINVNYIGGRQINFRYISGIGWTSKNNFGQSMPIESQVSGMKYADGINSIVKSTIKDESGNDAKVYTIELERQTLSSDFPEELSQQTFNILKKSGVVASSSTPSETFKGKALKNPENFIYKIYDKKNNYYIFYIYDLSDKKWKRALSSEGNYDWKTNLVNFRETTILGLAGARGFETLLKIYSNKANYDFYYIDKSTGIATIDM